MFWFENDVKEVEAINLPTMTQQFRVVLYGSSTLRMWAEVDCALPNYQVINRAFGGSTIAACTKYFERLMPNTNPDVIVFYAGDNDLGLDRYPEELLYAFKAMMSKIRRTWRNIPVLFLSIKAAPVHGGKIESIKYSNQIIKEEIDSEYINCKYVDIYSKLNPAHFARDGLHLNPSGYEVLQDVLNSEIQKLCT